MARKICNTNVLNIQKYVVAERFIRILKNKIYKYMTSISNGYIDTLDDIMNKYNDTYHRTIKIKAADVKPNMYIDFNKENNNEGSKFKVGGNVRILKYGNIFVEGYIPSWFELKRSKILCHGHILLVILRVKKLLEHLMKKNY